MTPPKHDPFKNPTIAEALCEIHFIPHQGQFWAEDWSGAVANRVRGRFPKVEKREIKQFQAEFGPNGLKVAEPSAVIPRSIYRSDQTGTLMQLSPGLLTVNEIAPYRGWDSFQADIKFAWEALAEVAQINAINRIGLRYINRLPRKDPDELLSEWLAKSPFIPEHLLGTSSRFISRIESGFNGSGKLIVTVAETVENTERPIIFDIDTITEKEATVGWSVVEKVIDDLHESVWSVFSGAIGPKLRKVLDKGQP